MRSAPAMMLSVLFVVQFSFSRSCSAQAKTQNIQLFLGFVTRVSCQGRILASAVGNEHLVKLDTLPQAIGCGVVLKPVSKSGSTNLILETSSGTIHRTITIADPQGRVPVATDLMISVRAAE